MLLLPTNETQTWLVYNWLWIAHQGRSHIIDLPALTFQYYIHACKAHLLRSLGHKNTQRWKYQSRIWRLTRSKSLHCESQLCLSTERKSLKAGDCLTHSWTYCSWGALPLPTESWVSLGDVLLLFSHRSFLFLGHQIVLVTLFPATFCSHLRWRALAFSESFSIPLHPNCVFTVRHSGPESGSLFLPFNCGVMPSSRMFGIAWGTNRCPWGVCQIYLENRKYWRLECVKHKRIACG